MSIFSLSSCTYPPPAAYFQTAQSTNRYKLNVKTRHTVNSCSTNIVQKITRRFRQSRKPIHASSSDEYGSFMDSEIVQQECDAIMREYDQLMRLMSKFPHFDTAGKRIYLDQMDGICEKLKIFNMRAKLSSDPMIKESLAKINKQLLFMNTNLDAIHEGMVQYTKDLRAITDAEEKIANPEQLQAFRKQLVESMAAQQQSQDKLASNLTMDKIMQDPATFQTLVSEPRALAAIQDVMGNPANIEKYRDNAALYTALKKIFEV